MYKVFVILRKEFIEIVQQRILLFSIILPPLLFAAIPLFLLQLGGNGSRVSSLSIFLTWGAAQLFQRETILTRWK